ncbi:MAG TPA: hypothetical protein VM327_07015 [Candidatus Thermoplasmatota archaeon]|nr:hypothetical protein [Candidatus Thermoplasmatota archaeon]
MKVADEGIRRYFFTPSDDGAAWVLVEALQTREGWEVRQAAKLGMRLLADVPPKDGDWVEAKPPSRKPRLPKPPASAGATPRPATDSTKTAEKTRAVNSAKSVATSARKPAKSSVAKAAAATRPVTKPARPAVPPEKLPGLSLELGALLADEQKRQKAPEGMVKCPACGLALQPTRNKRVRTHDDPLKASRCEASNKPWSEFQ